MSKRQASLILAAIQAEMSRRGWTCSEIARRSGVARSNLSAILSGRRTMNVGTADRLMLVLGLSVEPDK
jgi:plasmid maintenance system antidote protein VapI